MSLARRGLVAIDLTQRGAIDPCGPQPRLRVAFEVMIKAYRVVGLELAQIVRAKEGRKKNGSSPAPLQ